jgi:CheW-like domain
MTTSTLTALSPTTPETCGTIIFEVAGHSLALPSAAIAKINLLPESLNQEVQTGELIYLGNQVATFLDLHSALSHLKIRSTKGSETLSGTRKFLIIAYLEDTLCAIPVDKSPTLVTLPLADIQLLPQSYPKEVRSLFQHFIALPHPEGVRTIFLLNLKQVLNAID